jgi:hypothetical protein
MQHKIDSLGVAQLASLAWAGPAASGFDHVAGNDVQRAETAP